jgi:glycosyltransferase involved in cell wall biosynthesis
LDSAYHGGADICINIKDSEVPPKEPTLYLTNETNADKLDLSKYLGVIWPSQYAVDTIPVNNKTFILPHGYDSDKINTNHQKVKKQVLYASSPDRGLDLLAQIWPSVVEQHPDAHLYVTYGGEINTPNTTYGEFSEEEMNELYNTSDIWCYPCTGGELYGISGVKAQAAGTIPVYFPTMSLAETVQDGVICTDIRDMYEKLVNLLGDEEEKAIIRDRLTAIHFTNWEDSTDQLLSIIDKVVQ